MYSAVIESERNRMAGFEQGKMGGPADVDFSAFGQSDLGFAGANGDVAAAGEHRRTAAISHVKGGRALDGDIVPVKTADDLGRIGAVRHGAGLRLRLAGHGLRL